MALDITLSNYCLDSFLAFVSNVIKGLCDFVSCAKHKRVIVKPVNVQRTSNDSRPLLL